MKIFATIIAVLVVVLAPLASTPAGLTPKILWEGRVTLDEKSQLRGSISLRIGDHSVVLLRHPTSGCHELRHSEYFFHEVPENAVTAAIGWYAGSGEEFYVTIEGIWLVVFHRTVTETDPIPNYEKFTRIRLEAPVI